MSVRNTIFEQVRQIARDQAKDLPPLDDAVVLLETQFDSLCFALLVAGLEDRLGVDPFSEMETDQLPVTLGDLVALYDRAAAEAQVV